MKFRQAKKMVNQWGYRNELFSEPTDRFKETFKKAIKVYNHHFKKGLK